MNISEKPFLFNFSGSNINLKTGFISDEDMRILFIKRMTIREPVEVSVTFKIIKRDFISFLNYIENDTKKGRLKFYININNEGETFQRLFDISSNIEVSFSSNIYEINFTGFVLDFNQL